jgi:hypothetical protein
MSKCREAFEQHCKERVINTDGDYATDLYFDWQAAWNAATKNAAEISRQNNADLDECLWCDCAEAIEREQCK